MISHNLPHTVHDKCYHHDGQHDTKYYNNDKNMLRLCIVGSLAMSSYMDDGEEKNRLIKMERWQLHKAVNN